LKTFSQLLQQLWQQHPHQTAVHLLHNRQPDRTLTVAELIHGSYGYAQELARQKILPGEVVIIILQHGADLLFAFWGAVLHGAIPSIMPFLTEKLSPDQYRRSLAALFEVTAPAAVLTYSEFVPEVQQALAASKAAPGTLRAILASENIQPVEQIDFSTLPGLHRRPEDIVLLQHSSGTTGLQKGVALSHRSVFNQLESYTRAIRLSPADVVVSWLPLYHDMGLIAGFIMPILSGIPLVLLSPFDWVRAPYRLLQAVSQYKGTLSWLPNFAYNFCSQKIRERDLDGVDLSSWRAVINCSEPMYLKSHQAFQQRFQPYGLAPGALATCYAMAENVFAVSQGGIDSPVTVDNISQRAFFQERLALPAKGSEFALPMLSAGIPIENTRLRILDENRQELPERHIGEIAILSDCMLTEYYHRLDATAQAFHNGWYLTGDLGYLAGNEVYITGRKKDLIIVGGKNVYPQDLESLASEVEGVHPGRVAAFGVPNQETGTEDVIIVAELDSSSRFGGLSPEAIANTIRQQVTQGSDISLRLIKLVEHGWLLKTSSGKVARSANREKYLAELEKETLN
jgi:acyl-CoA synthetase (AMP-forming)/AMP-acid ligase II